MPAVVVPKTRILTGPGYLYKASADTLLPGQTQATVTNEAIASGVATLTTSAAHGLAVGDQVIVNIADADLNGLQTCTTGTATTSIKFATTAADLTSTATTGTARSFKAGGTVAVGKFTDAWPTGWTLIGVTKKGHEWSWSPKTGNIEVAEYLLPLAIVTTSIESKVSFEVAEFTAKNLAFGLNGATVATVSGTGATLLSELTPPVAGQELRSMIGWESQDSTERRFYIQCLQSGDNKVQHAKGTDNATIGMEFSLEQPNVGQAFRQFYAGSTPIGQ
jgi:hypothetical protein